MTSVTTGPGSVHAASALGPRLRRALHRAAGTVALALTVFQIAAAHPAAPSRDPGSHCDAASPSGAEAPATMPMGDHPMLVAPASDAPRHAADCCTTMAMGLCGACAALAPNPACKQPAIAPADAADLFAPTALRSADRVPDVPPPRR